MSDQQESTTRPPDAPGANGQVLAVFDRPSFDQKQPDRELRVTLEEFNGSRFIGLRVWNRYPNGCYPDKQGVSVRFSEAEEVAAAILDAARRFDVQAVVDRVVARLEVIFEEHGEEAFHGRSPFTDELRAMGQQLNDAGGVQAMREAWYRFDPEDPDEDPSEEDLDDEEIQAQQYHVERMRAAGFLDGRWSGIGEWVA